MEVRAYSFGNSPVHVCDARVKILLLLAYSVMLFFIETWAGIAGACLLFVGVWISARIPIRRMAGPLIPLYVLAVATILFNLFPLEQAQEGLMRGLFLACRMILLVAMSLVLCFTTTSHDLMRAFRSMLSPLRRFRVPVDDVALTLSLAIRFIPVAAIELSRVQTAQAARAASFETGTLRERLRAWGSVFVPLFVSLFSRTDRLAHALDARCYGAAFVRTELNETHWTTKGCGVLACGGGLCAALALLL